MKQVYLIHDSVNGYSVITNNNGNIKTVLENESRDNADVISRSFCKIGFHFRGIKRLGDLE